MSKLSNWFKVMLEGELDKGVVDDIKGEDREKYIEFSNEFWKFEGEDRDIVLEDLKKDEGILYNKMVDYNKNELIRKLGLNMVWWDYSLEDYFRDMFNKDDKWGKDEFSLFSLRDINRMVYGNDYNDDDWSYDD